MGGGLAAGAHVTELRAAGDVGNGLVPLPVEGLQAEPTVDVGLEHGGGEEDWRHCEEHAPALLAVVLLEQGGGFLFEVGHQLLQTGSFLRHSTDSLLLLLDALLCLVDCTLLELLCKEREHLPDGRLSHLAYALHLASDGTPLLVVLGRLQLDGGLRGFLLDATHLPGDLRYGCYLQILELCCIVHRKPLDVLQF